MDKFWATFSLTYKSKVKTKSFMIFTAIVVVLMLAAANINKIVDLFDNGPDKIGIVVNQDSIYKGVKAQSDHLDSDAKFKKMTESQAHQQVKNEIPNEIGVYVAIEKLEQKQKEEVDKWGYKHTYTWAEPKDGLKELYCIKAAKKQELKADKEVILSSMLRSMQRDRGYALPIE